jgi:hypothetical protein
MIIEPGATLVIYCINGVSENKSKWMYNEKTNSIKHLRYIQSNFIRKKSDVLKTMVT